MRPVVSSLEDLYIAPESILASELRAMLDINKQVVRLYTVNA